MDQKSITKAWSAVGVSAMYIALNGWVRTQTTKDFGLPLNLFKSFGPVSTAAIGILVCSILLLILCFLGKKYAFPHRGLNAFSRIPPAFGLTADPIAPEGKAYRALFFVLFVIFPFAALIHFNREFWTGPTPTSWDGLSTVGKMEFLGFQPFIPPGYRYDGDAFYPLYEPILLIILSLSAVCLLGLYLRAILTSEIRAGRIK